jgi:hypothetical protein
VGRDQYQSDFASDLDPGGDFGVNCAVGCLTENGTVQGVPGMIVWSDGTIDTFQYCSDVEGVASTCLAATAEAVPEPATLLLLCTGLMVIARWRFKKQACVSLT